MSFRPTSNAFEDTAAWGNSAPAPAGDVLKDAIRKEQIIKEIMAAQSDLRVMLERIDKVQAESEKIRSDNGTLQMYIDNLTKQLAKR